MTKQYTELHIDVKESEQEIFLAKIMNLPIDSVWQKEDGVVIYFESDSITKEVIEEISLKASEAKYRLEIRQSENKNWNQIWEESFSPISIGDFCYIRAEFHPKETVCKHSITINPKMAFGTAHHPTTYMMMQKMASLDLSNQRVLDFGCGTGILAVLAEKLGSADIVAIDYDEKAVSNTHEHIEINGARHIQVKQGDIPSLLDLGEFDLVLANINRQVLLNSVTKLNKVLKSGGLLLISGVLNTDQDLILESYQKGGFDYVDHNQRKDWMCYTFRRQ